MTRGAVATGRAFALRGENCFGPSGARVCSRRTIMSPYADGILRSLRRISRAVDIYSRQLASRVGLTGPQLVCLRHIARNGSITPSRLAREVHLSQATVTGIVDRLVGGGWVERSRGEVDRRLVSLAVTERGQDLLAVAPSALQETFLSRLEALPADEQARINGMLEKIVAMMDAQHLPGAAIAVGELSAEVEPADGAAGAPAQNVVVGDEGVVGSNDEREVSQ